MSVEGSVIAPNRTDILFHEGIASEDMSAWMNNVSRTITISGSGSPESVVEAPKRTLYMDEDAVASPGTFLYIKTTESGNTGWKLT